MSDLEKQIIDRFTDIFKAYNWDLSIKSCSNTDFIYLTNNYNYQYIWDNVSAFIFGNNMSNSIFEHAEFLTRALFKNHTFGFELNHILMNLKSDSLEELQIKMDLAGV